MSGLDTLDSFLVKLAIPLLVYPTFKKGERTDKKNF